MIYKKIGLNLEEENVIAFVGGGGKTTSIKILSEELKNMGKKVLITTTTMISYLEYKDNDKFILGDWPREYKAKEGTITLFGKTMVDGKIKGPDPEELKEIWKGNIFDLILIEADGANRKPITAPAAYEPVVPTFTKVTIGLVGLDSIGKVLDGVNAHRPELLREIFQVDTPHKIEPRDIIELITNRNGLFKDSRGKKIVFLNKADNDDLIFTGKIIRKLLEVKNIENVYITQLIYKEVY